MAQAEIVLKPRWSLRMPEQNRTRDMIEGPFILDSADGLNRLQYQVYRTYVEKGGKRVDYIVESVGLHSLLVDPRFPTDRPLPGPNRCNVEATIFAVKRKKMPDGSEETVIDLDCIDEAYLQTAFVTARYDGHGQLNVGSGGSAEPRFKYAALFAGHFDRKDLLRAIDMRRTIDEFMRQVNGENEQEAIDFGQPRLIPFHTPKHS